MRSSVMTGCQDPGEKIQVKILDLHPHTRVKIVGVVLNKTSGTNVINLFSQSLNCVGYKIVIRMASNCQFRIVQKTLLNLTSIR